MIKKIVGTALLLMAVAIAMTVNVANAQPLEKKKITIAVGGKGLFYYLPLTIAERQGYFKDEGLEVEIPDFAGGAKALQALVGGSADMVSGAFEHTINMQAKKQPITAVVLQAGYSSIVLVLRANSASTSPTLRATLPGFCAAAINSRLKDSDSNFECGLDSHSTFSFLRPCMADHVLSATTATPPNGWNAWGGLKPSTTTTCETPFTCLASASSYRLSLAA